MVGTHTEPHPRDPESEEELGEYLLNRTARRQALQVRLEQIVLSQQKMSPRRVWLLYLLCAALWGLCAYIFVGRINVEVESGNFWYAVLFIGMTVCLHTCLLVNSLEIRAARRERPLIEAILEQELRIG